jgi:CheY-like chemotaxis protein
MQTVLTVDDDPFLRGLLVLMLAKLDYQPIGVSNGIDAERMIAGLHPALVLLDIVMPTQDGYETCRHMRASGYRGSIVFLSAQPIAPEKIQASGADGFIQKPITRIALIHHLNTLYSQSAWA